MMDIVDTGTSLSLNCFSVIFDYLVQYRLQWGVVFVNGKSCISQENTVKSSKSIHSFTFSKFFQWARLEFLPGPRFDTLVYSQDETKLQRDEYYIKSGNPYLLSLLVPAHTLLVDMKLQPAAVSLVLLTKFIQELSNSETH